MKSNLTVCQAEDYDNDPLHDENSGGNSGHKDAAVLTQSEQKIQKPQLYKVLMHNDDYTPMDFVVAILERFFHKDRQQAQNIMLDVHKLGLGVCGVYTYEIAETKVHQVIEHAQKNDHPLRCTLVKD